MDYFQYSKEETRLLKAKDRVLAAAIERIGEIRREVVPDPFTGIICSVIAQQISTKGAQAVKKRLFELAGSITPQSVAALTAEQVKGCGMSYRKAQYIKGIADAAINGTVDFSRLDQMCDSEIEKVLTKLKGIGSWTVEMLLIFSLQRRDVLSYQDLGIRKGIMKAYQMESLSEKEFRKIKERLSPFGSIASLYFWKLAASENEGDE